MVPLTIYAPKFEDENRGGNKKDPEFLSLKLGFGGADR